MQLMRAVVGLLLAWLLGGMASSSAKASGRIEFDDRSHDFGRVQRGEVLKHRFRFKNTGKGPLAIQGLHAPCGCTTAKSVLGETYDAGASGSIVVKLDTADFQGPVTKTVTVVTDAQPVPERLLTVQAFVESELTAEPPLVDLGTFPVGTTAEAKVSVKPVDGFDLKLKGVEANAKKLDVSHTKEGKGWEILVKTKADLPAGFLREAVYVETNSRHLPELEIPVRGKVQGKIESKPDYIEFGAVKAEGHAKRSITLTAEKPFEVTGHEVTVNLNGENLQKSDAHVELESVAHEKGKTLVTVKLNHPGRGPGSAHGTLFLKTDVESQSRIPVEFFAYFQ